MGPVIKELVFFLCVSLCSFCQGKAVIEDFPNHYGGYEYTFDFKKNEHKHRPLFEEHEIPTTKVNEFKPLTFDQALGFTNSYVYPSNSNQKNRETLANDAQKAKPQAGTVKTPYKLTSHSVGTPLFEQQDLKKNKPPKLSDYVPDGSNPDKAYCADCEGSQSEEEQIATIVKKVKQKPKTKPTSKPKVPPQEKIKPNCESEKMGCTTSDYENSDVYIKVIGKVKYDKTSPDLKKDFGEKVDTSYLEGSAKPAQKPKVKEVATVPENDGKTKEPTKVNHETDDYCAPGKDCKDADDIESEDDVVILKPVSAIKKEKHKPEETKQKEKPPKNKDSYSNNDDDKPDLIDQEKVNQEAADYCGSEDCKNDDIENEDYEMVKPVSVIKKEDKPKETKQKEKPPKTKDEPLNPIDQEKVNQDDADYCGSEEDCKNDDIENEDYEMVKPVSVIKKEDKPKETKQKEEPPKIKDSYSDGDNYEPSDPVDQEKVNKEDADYCGSEDDCKNADDIENEDYEMVKPVSAIKKENKNEETEQKEEPPKTEDSYSDSDDDEPSDPLKIVKIDKSKEQKNSKDSENMKPIFPAGDGKNVDEIDKGEISSRSRIPFQSSNLWSLVFNPGAKDHKLKPCVTRTNESGLCMYVNQCPVPNIASSMEQLLNNACVVDDVFIGVCCPEFPVETVKVEWEDSGKSVDEKVENEFDNGNGELITAWCHQYEESLSNLLTGFSLPDCGTRSKEASTNQLWPWKAQLVSMSNGRIFCGGVLIDKEFVLTAAHCTTKIPRNQILVRLGQHNESSGEDFVVTEIKRHAQYNSRTLLNDIALLKLGRRIQPTSEVNIICLPDDDDVFGDKAMLLGWQGKFGKNHRTEELVVLSNSACQERMSTNVPQSMLCTEARSEAETTCNADSGAPLVVEDDNRYKVVGILSWNRNDCDKRFPSVFSRVSSFVKWIRRHAN